jgi:hypothetical protein
LICQIFDQVYVEEEIRTEEVKLAEQIKKKKKKNSEGEARRQAFEAARTDDTLRLLHLITTQQVEPNTLRRPKTGETLMHTAARAGAVSVLQELGDRGMNHLIPPNNRHC